MGVVTLDSNIQAVDILLYSLNRLLILAYLYLYLKFSDMLFWRVYWPYFVMKSTHPVSVQKQQQKHCWFIVFCISFCWMKQLLSVESASLSAFLSKVTNWFRKTKQNLTSAKLYYFPSLGGPVCWSSPHNHFVSLKQKQIETTTQKRTTKTTAGHIQVRQKRQSTRNADYQYEILIIIISLI